MRNEQEIINQYHDYQAKLLETNRKLQEAIYQEDLKAIEIFKSNQIMFTERLMALEWVLETVDCNGLPHSCPDAVSTRFLEA